jgi:gamma-glutamyltranspeptidase
VHPVDAVATQHLEIEAMKLASPMSHRYVGDPATMRVNLHSCSIAAISRRGRG